MHLINSKSEKSEGIGDLMDFIITAERSLNATPGENQALSAIREPDSGKHDDRGAGEQLSPPIETGTTPPNDPAAMSMGTGSPNDSQSQRAVATGIPHPQANSHPDAMAAADWQTTGNHYKTITAEQGLEVTQDEYNALKVALEAANQDGASGQWGLEHFDSKVYVSAKFRELWWLGLKCAFLRLLCSLIAKNGLSYLGFFKTFTCDALRMRSDDGKYFRVKSDGSVWELKLTWVSARAIPKVREPHFEKQGNSEGEATFADSQSQRAIACRPKRPGNGHVGRNGHVHSRVMARYSWSHGEHVELMRVRKNRSVRDPKLP